MARSHDHDVDALREKLKALGYLDAGVDRFVLAPARSGRTLWSIASRSSLRIAILVGVALGLSVAVAAGVMLPGLVTGVRDTIVLAAMLALALGAGAGATALAVILASARVIRWLGPRPGLAARVRPLALAAGAIVGAVCLAYLTFWWRAMDTVPGERSWWNTLVALAVATAISLLLGHATSLTAQAVITNEWPDAGQTRRAGLSLRGSLALAAVAIVAAAGLLAISPGGQARDEAPPTLTVVGTGTRLVVFAVDGFDEALGAKYIRAGGERPVPALLRSMPRQSEDPAREWTTIATGQPVERHGVTALEVRRLAGMEGGHLPSGAGRSTWTSALAAATDMLRLTRPAINTGAIRREKTFWEVAALAGLRTVAVNWWTSWPAREADGTVLTERAVLRLQAGGPLADEIAPAGLYARLKARWPELSARADDLAERVVAQADDTPPAPAAKGLVATTVPLAAQVGDALRAAARVDAQQLVLFRELLTDQVDLATVYLPGLDILGAKLRVLGGEQASTALLVESAEALRRYYAWLVEQMDVTAAASLEGRQPGTVAIRLGVLLVAHPGRSGAQGPAVLSAWPGSGWPPAEPASPGGPSAGTLYDVAPTVLRVLGVPLSRELSGEPVWPVVSPGAAVQSERVELASTPAPAKVATYGRRGVGQLRAGGTQALDEEMRERLRSLGYVR